MRHRIAVLIFVALGCLNSAAAAQIDPSGSWRTWHTEHFRVHAKAEYSHQALVAASEAERAYGLLATELKPPRGTVDVVLGDDVDFSNGYATVFPSNRLVVYLTPPSSTLSTGPYDVWLRLVLTHELTHLFHLDRADGVWQVLQTVFGRAPGLFPNTYQPTWVTEGIATYYESRFSSAGRIRGAYHDQLLIGAARDGTWPNPADATGVNRVWPAGARPYAWGSRFFESQRQEFGDSIIPRFIDRTSRQLIVFNVDSPNRAAGATGVAATWGRLRQTAEVAGVSSDVFERGLRVEPSPRISPDGRHLVYQRSDGKNATRLVIIDLSDNEVKATKRINSLAGLAWSDSGIYFTQLDYASPVQIRSDLYLWQPAGTFSRLSRGARYSDVFTLPGGGIGIVGLANGARRVFISDREASDVVGCPVPRADDWGRFAVSPDGRWVAAPRHYSGKWDIALWPWGRPDEFRLITQDAALDADPVWADGGETLLFSSERLGLPQIFVHDLVSGDTRVVTHEPTGAREPALASDGTLVYSTVFGDGYALVMQRGWTPSPVRASQETDPPYVAPSPGGASETGYSPWGALAPRYWIPIGHDESAAGLFMGALTSGYDAIGRTTYAALAMVAPGNGRWEALLSLTHSRWRSWTLDLTAAQTWDYGGLAVSSENTSVPVSFKEHSAELGLGHRWRRWRTAAGARVATFLERDLLVNDGADPLPFTPSSPAYAGGKLSASVSHYDRPALAISPENGASASGLYIRRWELAGPGWSYELRGGLTGYLALPLPGFAHWVLAGRVTAGMSGGSNPTVFAVGGESGSLLELVPGTTVGSGRRTFPLRGYDELGRFTRATTASLELRIPLLLAGKGVGKLPLLVDNISASLFGEIGGGWNEGEEAQPAALADVGGELVADLGVGAGLALRARVGWAVALRTGHGSERGQSRLYLAFGPSF